ncbi:flagellar hook-basal body complex protein FliE [Aquisalimonas asiatica]|uniref:Flagellar hook-basal body complex protein FliE n=1 Tax=Aquisalimonas asiatica TaxID=406100 RepID=A0A1H8QTS9_9GAMM|nr:flagellar hook-basal body complex protein FliE [Aquisalimonas asiatica]SEO57361.1 flagellar hook-basal body complex protein FliE [Aquisalimonas asiatica]
MNPVTNDNVTQALEQMQAMVDRAGGAQETEQAADGPQFVEALREALDGVNDAQQESAALQDAFIGGEDVDLTDVMVSMQKSSVAFEATKQVRNHLVEAYQDIYNMPV